MLKATAPKADSLAIEPFGHVVEVVDMLGPKIWIEGNHAHLLAPGEVEEYTEALIWPSDRDK